MHIIFNNINGYIEDDYASKYLTLIPVDENKRAIKMYKEIWNKIKLLNESENNGSGDYDNKYLKIRFSSDNNLSLKKELEMYGVVITVLSVCFILKYF